MNRDDIVRMAREAGLYHFYDSEGHCTGITDATLVDEEGERNDDRLVEILAPFASIVAAAERESMTKDGWRRCAVGQRTTQFCGMLEDAVKAEREACAKVCEERERANLYGFKECAAAIRARGEK